jgi:hypothetical protein
MSIGNTIHPEFRDSTSCGTISVVVIENLQDLTNAINGTPLMKRGLKQMLNTTANHVSGCLNKPPEQIGIDDLVALRPRLKVYLRERHFKPNAVRAYCYYARLLLKMAGQFGWISTRPDVTNEWDKILQCVSGRHGATQVVKYAISLGKKPEHFTDTDLEDWKKLATAQGRTNDNVRVVAGRFRNRIFRAGLDALIPNLSRPRLRAYGQRLAQIPEPIRTEIMTLREWKTAEFSQGRKSKSRHRAVSAQTFQDFTCRYYGFVSRVERKQVSDMKALFNEDSMFNYVNWCRNERHVRKVSLFVPLTTLYRVVKTYPYFKGVEFGWLKSLLDQLTDNEEDRSLVNEAKQRKWVYYDKLCELPEKMRRDAEKKYERGSKRYACAMRDILLIIWLLTLPWRQRNIREMRIGRREDGANIFKAGISDLPTIARPNWVTEQLRQNPGLEVWQFRFRTHETKTGRFIHGILPKQIAVPLEQYLNSYRPLLVSGADPRTVFLSDSGKPFTPNILRYHVVNATFRYFGRCVNPHLFRDIFAVKFLEEHPENYLTLSKILWHLNVNTTIGLYGRNYDESHGARAAEDWLDQHAKKK